MTLRSRATLWLSAVLVVTLSACGSDEASPDVESGDATGTAAFEQGPLPAEQTPEHADGPPSVSAVMDHIEYLAGEVGPRPASGPAEREAAGYISDVLDDSGYESEIERFTYIAAYDDSRALLPGDEEIEAFMLGGSSSGNAYGRPVFGGTGQQDELAGLDVEGHILLLDRGAISFAEKVRNAEEAGAQAVVIVNNRPGGYQGTLGDMQAAIPVVGVAQGAREQLHDLTGRGMLTVIAQGGRREQSSQNVVGREGEECRAYLGAHYDSVPGSPGANDNASGVGLMLELARVYRADGLCVVAFGAEEVGLWGSQAFVRDHEVSDAAFMLNFDMVGKVTRPIIVGDDGLTSTILRLLDTAGGTPLNAGSFPPFASSDHVSFTAAGVPAVTIHSGDDVHLHTEFDDLDNVDTESVSVMLRASEIALSGLLRQHGIVGD